MLAKLIKEEINKQTKNNTLKLPSFLGDVLVTLAPKPVFAKWLVCMALLPKTLDAETVSVQKGLPSGATT